jgi:hypothetical protein
VALSREQVLEVLSKGDFKALVGEFEGEWLECKRSPYVLTHEGQRAELAKDVSALANAKGGLLIIGVSTAKDQSHGRDVIDDVTPILLEQFDEVQYRDLIAAWTLPQLRNIDIRIHREPGRPTHGLVSIDIPPCPPSEMPVLVCKTILDDGRRADIVFGYCERKLAGVTHHDAARIHSLIAQGMSNSEILERLDFLTASQARRSIQDTAASTPGNVDGRINEAIAAAKLTDQPCFLLAAYPMVGVNADALFASKSNPLVQLLEHPPEIRNAGFDLTVDHSSHIVRGSLRRSVSEESKLIEMHHDGVVIFVSRGDSSGLCWGREKAQSTKNLINQLVLIESTYLFARFIHSAYGGLVTPGTNVTYRMALINVCSAERPCALFSGPLDRWGYGTTREATDSLAQVSVMESYDSVAPARVAFLLLSKLYAWFGFESDNIPYSSDTADGTNSIDEEKLVAAGKPPSN